MRRGCRINVQTLTGDRLEEKINNRKVKKNTKRRDKQGKDEIVGNSNKRKKMKARIRREREMEKEFQDERKRKRDKEEEKEKENILKIKKDRE